MSTTCHLLHDVYYMSSTTLCLLHVVYYMMHLLHVYYMSSTTWCIYYIRCVHSLFEDHCNCHSCHTSGLTAVWYPLPHLAFRRCAGEQSALQVRLRMITDDNQYWMELLQKHEGQHMATITTRAATISWQIDRQKMYWFSFFLNNRIIVKSFNKYK